ncbi:uncharacterized protein HD556DRAFT_1446473 [Suillus plorans]|uniref:Uncharacterized protein n=1 Tax=Suillus plorans TaxID=116603 RepID=A0A9P7AI89_9AGAM|nr:uncharacterized protein HD556DRAFT_1446473 [Suillus plorans]KAG1790123.1 hypothetical protein HD556DRAFT_1446473 [Suillus plorans]
MDDLRTTWMNAQNSQKDTRPTPTRVLQQLTVAEKQAHNAQVLQACQEKRSAARANPKAVQHDMNAAFTFMDHEWTALCTCMGMQGFYIAVCGVIKDLLEPKIFFTKKAHVKLVLSEEQI